MNLRGINKNKGFYITLLLTVLIAVSVIVASTLYAVDNVEVSQVTFVKDYRSITLNWSYDSSTTATYTADFFAIYRAKDGAGLDAHRIAVVSGNTKTFTDVSLIPQETYHYAVVHGSAGDLISDITTSTLSWSAGQQVPAVGPQNDVCINPQNGTSCYQSGCHTRSVVLDANPHATIGGKNTEGKTNNTCAMCHVEHGAAGSSTQILSTTQDAIEPNARIAVCENCHLSTGVSEKNFVQSVLTTPTSGHVVKNAEHVDGVLECSLCHGAHMSSDGNKGALVQPTIVAFGSLDSSITVNTSEKNAQCVACHDDAQTWYKAAYAENYPSSESYESTASLASGYAYYPVLGTFPGKSIANSFIKNGHASINAQDTYDKGDCRYCHSSHGSAARFDGLLSQRGELRGMKSVGGVISDAEQSSGAYASFCLSCHNGSNSGSPWAQASDIAQYVSVVAGSSEASYTAFLTSNAGHRIKTDASELPQGSALPCYACHNPHGSATNDMNFSDALGKNLTNIRDMCFTCHTSSDGLVCEDGQDGQGTVVELAHAKRQEVYGISRASSALKLSDRPAHASTSSRPCSDCHGNVHAPLLNSAEASTTP